MKNVLIIDGADNCVYDIFEITDEQFRILFPNPGQDIAFAEDFDTYLSQKEWTEKMSDMWDRRVQKRDVRGIHGTIFYELEHKREYYPTDKDEEACNPEFPTSAVRQDGVTFDELLAAGKVSPTEASED